MKIVRIETVRVDVPLPGEGFRPAWGPGLLQRSWSSEDTRRTASEHRAIYEALRVGDPELAAFAMERHLRSLIAAMFDDGAFDGPPPRFYA